MADDHQHYVPQLLLRNFAVGSKRNRQIWAFDKKTERSFKTAIRNVASEGHFYDFSVAGGSRSLDPVLQRLEDLVAADLRQVVQQRILPKSSEARTRIAFFVAVQMVRTKAYRLQSIDLTQSISKEIEKRGGWVPATTQAFVFDRGQAEAASIKNIPHLARNAAPLIFSKSWILYSTTSADPFFIGDNPVTLDNSTYGPDVPGSLGLASTGVEICMPLSSTLSMGFLCPSNEIMIRDGARRFGSMLESLPNSASVSAMLEAFDGEAPLPFTTQNVMRHNSLQVSYAEQYVFSCEDNFELVREMVGTNPKNKSGRRFTIA